MVYLNLLYYLMGLEIFQPEAYISFVLSFSAGINTVVQVHEHTLFEVVRMIDFR